MNVKFAKNFRVLVGILILTACTASNALVIYGSAFSNSESRSKLYTIDSTTGLGTLVGGDTIAFFPGLAFSSNGSLFGSGSSLWSVNPTNGHAVSIGALPELIVSIAFDPQGNLWGVGNGTGTLWRLNTSNGTSLAAGFLSGLGAGGIRSIAFDSSGTLFGIGQGVLYNINTATFAASSIAAIIPCCTVSGLTFSSSGTLYTSQGTSLSSNSSLSVVNVQTGILSAVGPSSLTPPAVFIEGLAIPIAAVPEVGTGLLLILGLLMIWVAALRRRTDA